MSDVVVAFKTEPAFELGVVAALIQSGVDASRLKSANGGPGDAHCVVAGADDMPDIADSDHSLASILCIVDNAIISDVRKCIRMGATGIIDRSVSTDQLVLLVKQLPESDVDYCPRKLLNRVASSLSDPPRDLTAEEAEFLGLATSASIEDSGEKMGLSRRQAQRWFASLSEEFNFANHFVAAATAARWGLGIPLSNGR